MSTRWICNVLVLCHRLFFGVIEGGMGNVFFARVGLRNYTGKSRCIPTLRRDTSGLTHATRILSCDKALVTMFNDSRDIRRYVVGCVFCMALPILAGCGFSGGQLLYMMGVGQAATIEAQFRLADEPILVLVDDPGQAMDWPPAWKYITDDLSQALVKHEAAKRVVARATIENLRRTHLDFAKRGCREIGQLAGASQVLWVEIKDFLAQEDIHDANNAAYIMVTVKVIDAHGEKRSRVRVWPTSPSGHVVSARLSGSDVARLRTKDAISKELSALLTDRIAKLFYDYEADEFDGPS